MENLPALVEKLRSISLAGAEPLDDGEFFKSVWSKKQWKMQYLENFIIKEIMILNSKVN